MNDYLLPEEMTPAVATKALAGELQRDWARTETVPAGPLRTVMSPERVCTSRFTGPLT